MRTRTLLPMAGALIMGVAVAGPVSAKAYIAEATISGPGLGAGMTIEAPYTDGLWESGIDVGGGLDDARADSIAALRLTPAELGPRYAAIYRFDVGPANPDDPIRQDLYPYAKGGPVTYTPPGQRLTGELGIRIVAGWYQSSLGFFHYLVDHGLPERNLVTPVASRESGSYTAPGAPTTPLAGIVLTLTGVTALLLMAPTVRRRVLALTRRIHFTLM
jgi:hypothetical protein